MAKSPTSGSTTTSPLGKTKESNSATTKNLLLVHGKSLLEIPIIKIKPKHIHDALRSLMGYIAISSPTRIGEDASLYLTTRKSIAGSLVTTPHGGGGQWNTCSLVSLNLSVNITPRWITRRFHSSSPALRKRQDRSVAAVALEFCIITATRSGETLGMRWTEVDIPNRIWTIPGNRMKKGREHIVPLSDRAIEILRRRQEHKHGDYVFFGYQRDKALDDKSMRLVLHKMGVKATTHGFRSSFRDWAGDTTDYARETIEFCLAHLVGNTTEAPYRRRTSLEKRRALMAEWAAHCCRLCG